jgi:hypothetical protein
VPGAADGDIDAAGLRAAHRHSSIHRDEVMASDACACFYCLKSFPPSEIGEWVDGGKTALCPRCGIDSVLGSASPYPLTPAFLRAMHSMWFE